MLQTTLCVPLEVKPESAGRLTALIDTLKQREDVGGGPTVPNFARIFAGAPTLHFMSMSVFPGRDFDPLFIIEANFDGPPGPFWGQIEALFSADLRPMLRCCKRPFDGTGELYDAVTRDGAVQPAVAYLQAQTQAPSVFFHGNRGLSRARILDEAALFVAARDAVDGPAVPNPFRGIDAAALHARLRGALLPRFGWLNEAPPPRITPTEKLTDIFRLLRFVVLLLLGLSLPGIILALIIRWELYLIVVALLTAAAVAGLWRYRHALAGTEVRAPSQFRLLSPARVVVLAAGVAAYIVVAAIVIAPLVAGLGLAVHAIDLGPMLLFWPTMQETAMLLALGLLSVAATAPVLLLVLRWNELRDSHQDAPPIDDAVLREMVRREDWIMQNHMGSLVVIKPGILRSIIIRAGHYGLGLFLRVTATDGYLGSMRTVHFAHWAFLNNNSRLLFFSNFDHSWDSYLDDFIEKSHAGLTLAWGTGVGFPRTRMLIYDGASHGRQFKTWALASRTVSRFWYSAYRDLTVDQIERNHRLATGLRQATMTEAAATTWAWDL